MNTDKPEVELQEEEKKVAKNSAEELIDSICETIPKVEEAMNKMQDMLAVSSHENLRLKEKVYFWRLVSIILGVFALYFGLISFDVL